MRIAIVNDMPMAVEALRRVVAGARHYEIAWIARDGAEAVDKCTSDRPDLVLMDLIMPVVNGVEATRRIMRTCPCAILVVTATVQGNTPLVFEAMGHGALDAVNTPVLGGAGDTSGGSALLDKIATIGRLIGKTPRARQAKALTVERGHSTTKISPLIAVGASTGGPRALAEVLSKLPADWAAALVIIQHVDASFAPGLASWLGGQTPLAVRLAETGDRPTEATALIAATNDHLILTSDLTLAYTREPADYPYRPSADVFFKSAAIHWPGCLAGVLLTGMGRDGAEGLLAMRRAGCHTVAQDKETSVVYGMPKAAAELEAAAEILPIDKVAPALLGLVGRHGAAP